MKKIAIIALLTFILTAVFLLFSGRQSTSVTVIKNEFQTATGQEEIPVATQAKKQEPARPLFVSGWLPYWAKKDGADSLKETLKFFDEVNPFSFQINTEGKIVDAVDIERSPWTELIADAEAVGTQIIPTLLWTDSKAMHKVMGDENLLQDHIAEILRLLEKYNFPGADVDYEGKDVADKNLFTNFIQKLGKKMKAGNKKLSCTIEARTSDHPPANWDGVRAMSYANDIPALAESCDEIRIMSYDEIFQRYGTKKSFQSEGERPFAPNADINWVEQVVNYMLEFVPKEKLVLGIPTYGWEFEFSKNSNGFLCNRYKSVSFPEAIQKAETAKIQPARNQGGEMDFIYLAEDGKQHIVNFSDAQAIRQKIELAKKYQLKGISIFKIDGKTDPELFSVLAENKQGNK